MNIDVFGSVVRILASVVSPSLSGAVKTTKLLGDIPEFDSMSVVNLMGEIEERFDLIFDDSEIDASVFDTVGSLTVFVENKIRENGAT